MQQKPAGFHFAGATEIGRLNRQSVEGIGPVNHAIRRENRAEFQRERVKRPRELVSRDDQRHGDAALLPASRTPGAGLEVGHASSVTRASV